MIPSSIGHTGAGHRAVSRSLYRTLVRWAVRYHGAPESFSVTAVLPGFRTRRLTRLQSDVTQDVVSVQGRGKQQTETMQFRDATALVRSLFRDATPSSTAAGEIATHWDVCFQLLRRLQETPRRLEILALADTLAARRRSDLPVRSGGASSSRMSAAVAEWVLAELIFAPEAVLRRACLTSTRAKYDPTVTVVEAVFDTVTGRLDGVAQAARHAAAALLGVHLIDGDIGVEGLRSALELGAGRLFSAEGHLPAVGASPLLPALIATITAVVVRGPTSETSPARRVEAQSLYGGPAISFGEAPGGTRNGRDENSDIGWETSLALLRRQLAAVVLCDVLGRLGILATWCHFSPAAQATSHSVLVPAHGAASVLPPAAPTWVVVRVDPSLTSHGRGARGPVVVAFLEGAPLALRTAAYPVKVFSCADPLLVCSEEVRAASGRCTDHAMGTTTPATSGVGQLSAHRSRVVSLEPLDIWHAARRREQDGSGRVAPAPASPCVNLALPGDKEDLWCFASAEHDAASFPRDPPSEGWSHALVVPRIEPMNADLAVVAQQHAVRDAEGSVPGGLLRRLAPFMLADDALPSLLRIANDDECGPPRSSVLLPKSLDRELSLLWGRLASPASAALLIEASSMALRNNMHVDDERHNEQLRGQAESPSNA